MQATLMLRTLCRAPFDLLLVSITQDVLIRKEHTCSDGCLDFLYAVDLLGYNTAAKENKDLYSSYLITCNRCHKLSRR